MIDSLESQSQAQTLIALSSKDFAMRHIGPNEGDIAAMLKLQGLSTLEELMAKTLPATIRHQPRAGLPSAHSEEEALDKLKSYAEANKLYKSFIGMGYYGTHMPKVILRNVLENPGWYTAYTPYQAEISQGRLEALSNFQQMVMDLTGMEVANASLLDEATAAAEAMTMLKRVNKKQKSLGFFVADDVHPQSLEVIRTRAEYFDFEIYVDAAENLSEHEVFGALLQYPGTTGRLTNLEDIVEKAHAKGILVAVASDLLSLVLLKSPGECGADVVIGSAQRFGVPMGFGGPHAAFFATRDDYKRNMPGRVIGLSKDAHGRIALRMAMQTREQHIRREKATSNICTAQALLANMAAFYAIYHGPQGLKKIAQRVHQLTKLLANLLSEFGIQPVYDHYVDTLCFKLNDLEGILKRSQEMQVNLCHLHEEVICLSLDETTTIEDIQSLVYVLSGYKAAKSDHELLHQPLNSAIPEKLKRQSNFLNHPVFNRYHSESEMLRYLKRLENKDYSLTHGMIPLGSCTMKLNATSEMIPITWEKFANIHPFAPSEQHQGYQQMITELAEWLTILSGYDAMSMQPNSGAQGEYAGLLSIRKYHESLGQVERNICLIPSSAHGTNPASASMMGLEVVVVRCDDEGNIDIDDLKTKAEIYSDKLSSLMVTYPSTHGVFEEGIIEICNIIHQYGGQVYMDGANMNAQVGLTSPGAIGADVSHLNLHKTFCIPHGGGGPGMGPIGVKAHLAPFLPNHSVKATNSSLTGAVNAAPFGSALILPISWMYIYMMGEEGLKRASEVAILNANYIAKRLEGTYPILYKGREGYVAHECIIDIRPMKEACEISEEDIAKRLMDYGFHAPTMSFPVAGTLMIEPTESESKAEIDRFCEALLSIRQEIAQVEKGEVKAEESVLRHAPHTSEDLINDWQRTYSREMAVFPSLHSRQHKFWPSVNRIDNVYGDRHFVCSCPPMEAYGLST